MDTQCNDESISEVTSEKVQEEKTFKRPHRVREISKQATCLTGSQGELDLGYTYSSLSSTKSDH